MAVLIKANGMVRFVAPLNKVFTEAELTALVSDNLVQIPPEFKVNDEKLKPQYQGYSIALIDKDAVVKQKQPNPAASVLMQFPVVGELLLVKPVEVTLSEKEPTKNS